MARVVSVRTRVQSAVLHRSHAKIEGPDGEAPLNLAAAKEGTAMPRVQPESRWRLYLHPINGTNPRERLGLGDVRARVRGANFPRYATRLFIQHADGEFFRMM